MTIQYARRSIIIVIAVLLMVDRSEAGPNDPVSGSSFDRLVASQIPDVQKSLSTVLVEKDGFYVTGPLRPPADDSTADPGDRFFESVRVLCAELDLVDSAIVRLERNDDIKVIRYEVYLDYPSESVLNGFRGAFLTLGLTGDTVVVSLQTVHQMRFLIWAQSKTLPFEKNLSRYGMALSDYLNEVDRGDFEAEAPTVESFELPDSMDFYAPQPDYLISGYDQYMNFLFSHRPIMTDFANGVTAFVPSDSLRKMLIKQAPKAGYPNKEWPALQSEYREFTQRGGSLSFMNTLTRAGFDTLRAGEYFFAVGLSGNVRFGLELPRREVKAIEERTGRRMARANHAFLFPGEPILTAGAFFIEQHDGQSVIAEVNAQSGHYFYSNLSATIREDISVRSDQYLLTLGHFLKALESLDIPHDDILVKKF